MTNMQSNNSISEMIQSKDWSFSLTTVRLILKKALSEDEGRLLGVGAKVAGDVLQLPRWTADVLLEAGYGEVQNEVFDVEMFRTLTREKMQVARRLSSIDKDFYARLRRHLGYLKLRTSFDADSSPILEKISASATDLLTLRASKILAIANSSSVSEDVLNAMVPEERSLFETVRRIVSSWRETILKGASFD